jgi:hypothetical protein
LTDAAGTDELRENQPPLGFKGKVTAMDSRAPLVLIVEDNPEHAGIVFPQEATKKPEKEEMDLGPGGLLRPHVSSRACSIPSQRAASSLRMFRNRSRPAAVGL